jgi:hypothetical protein
MNSLLKFIEIFEEDVLHEEEKNDGQENAYKFKRSLSKKYKLVSDFVEKIQNINFH